MLRLVSAGIVGVRFNAIYEKCPGVVGYYDLHAVLVAAYVKYQAIVRQEAAT